MGRFVNTFNGITFIQEFDDEKATYTINGMVTDKRFYEARYVEERALMLIADTKAAKEVNKKVSRLKLEK